MPQPLQLIEQSLRLAVARGELNGMSTHISSYCTCASSLLSEMAPDDPARREGYSQVIGTLAWAELMIRAARASRVDAVQEASRMALYLETRLSEARCR